MNIVHISPASLADLDAVQHIENTCFGEEAFHRQQLRYLIAQAKGVFLLAKKGDETLGYLSLTTSQRHHTGRIYSIAVLPSHRNLGLGKLLLQSALQSVRELQLRALFLEVRLSNQAAIALYESYGFVKRAEKKNYYLNGESAYSMVRRVVNAY